MKQQNTTLRLVGAVGLVLSATLLSGAAAATNTTLVARARAANVTAPPAVPLAELPVPQSTFVIPRKASEGKDPFFPGSTRVYSIGVNAKPVAAPSVIADLTLKGISGTAEQPLAIINTTTFTTGETNDVLFKNGRIKVQCLEINMGDGTVLIQVGAERRQLRLQPVK